MTACIYPALPAVTIDIIHSRLLLNVISFRTMLISLQTQATTSNTVDQSAVVADKLTIPAPETRYPN